jgi:sulfite exporter TauE/SafE
MIALWSTIGLSSLAGSLHCVAMCGPLVGLHGGARSLRLALVHALGRLTTYAALGALAGALGRALDLAGHLAAIQHGAAIVAGAVIVGWGVHTIAVARGWTAPRAGAGAMFQRGLVQLRGRRAAARAWLLGALTGLLPCGWLWAFVVSAAGTASPGRGAAVMAVFWLGTVPAMTGVLALGGPALARLRRRLPVISAGLLIALGLATLATRWADAGGAGVTAPHCHRSSP